MYTELFTIQNQIITTLMDNKWGYISSENLGRDSSDVMVESMVRDALLRLNPELTDDESHADEIINKLRGLFASTDAQNLVSKNEEFKSMVYEERLFETKGNGILENNQYVVTDNWTYTSGSQSIRLDIVLLINGLPVVIGALKNPSRPSVTWLDAAQVIGRFEQDFPQMFVSNIFNFATEGRELRYASISTPAERWNIWHVKNDQSEKKSDNVYSCMKDMITPYYVMGLFQFFIINTEHFSMRQFKRISRYYQLLFAYKIVNRVCEGHPRNGLIWLSSGSGKTLTMLFAVEKICNLPELKDYTVIIVEDYLAMVSQITENLQANGITNVTNAITIDQLEDILNQSNYKVVTTLISCFENVEAKIISRDNIVVIVEECNSPRIKGLCKKMQLALPNAFFFGLTGTPINRNDRDALSPFIADEDTLYMDKYSFSDAAHDNPTLPLYFELGPKNLRADTSLYHRLHLYNELFSAENSSDDWDMPDFMHKGRRISSVCNSIANHFTKKLKPYGYKAMVVAYDSYCCLEYKKLLDTLLGAECSTVIIDVNDGDDDNYKIYQRSEAEEMEVLNHFMDKNDPLKILIVTNKLLTSIDAPILQTIYLDKPLKGEELIQTISRVSRPYDDEKSHGLVVDYFGVFDQPDKYLAFDDKSVKRFITNIADVEKMFPAILCKCLSYFMGMNRTVDDTDSLKTAMAYIPTDNEKDMFALDYQELNQAWNILYPDPVLDPLQADYIWLTRIYEAAKPADGSGGLVWKSPGKKTEQLLL